MSAWRSPWLALLALAPLVPFFQARVESRLGEWRAQHEVLYVWSGEHLRLMSDGFRDLMADVYWLRTVQYFGAQRVFDEDKKYELLEPLVQITTTLDPRMEIAYRYGATFLAESWPTGAGQPEAAVALLRQGVDRNPHSWRLKQDLALFHLFFLKEPQTASGILLEASEEPGAPPYFAGLAAAVLARGGERAAARELWAKIRDQAEPGPMRDNASVNLGILMSMDAVDAFNAASESFRQQAGRPARSLEELVASGLIRGSLVDPGGTPYAYDPATGRASVDPKSILYRRRYF